MKLALSIVLFTWNISFVQPSCPENESAMFCSGSYLVPQVYCGGVEHEERWRCTRKENVRCGCDAGYARENNGKCVLVNECVKGIYQFPSPPDDRKTLESGSPHNSPTHQGTGSHLNELGHKALKFLLNTTDIYLVKVSNTIESEDNCVCRKSTFEAIGDGGIERTLRCYKYIPSTTKYVEFNVSSHHNQAWVTLKYAVLPSTVTDLNKGPLYLSGAFIVLGADEDCLIMKLERGEDGKDVCLLWEIITDSQTQSSACLPKLNENCPSDFRDLRNNITDCKRQDASDKRAQKHADEEEANRE